MLSDAEKRNGMMLLKIGALAAIAVAVPTRFNDQVIDSTTYEVISPRIPAAFEGFRIVQISDIHNRSFAPHQSQLLDHVRAARPDLIVITGDLTYHGKWSSDYVHDLARGLVEIAPAYFVTGNHDITSKDLPGMMRLLEEQEVQVLAGRNVIIKRGKKSIAVAGIDDPSIFYDRRKSWSQAIDHWKTALAALRKSTQRGSYTVLLSHRPELITSYAGLGFDLVLAGHAHGGQVRLPFIGAVYAPDQGLFPRYTSGMYSMGKTRMIVSRGLGGSHFPFRIFNHAELVVVRLTRCIE